MDEYLDGTRLYGDDFSPEEIAHWFADEAEGYANLVRSYGGYRYEYHALNVAHGFAHLPRDRRFGDTMSFGGAYGDELKPLLSRIDRITMLEPSDLFDNADIEGVPIRRVKPRIDGAMPFPDASFDLVTCLGVLHHIPNVSFVVKEIGRVTRPGGWALVREPIVSMGDWTRPRRGATRRERGIPVGLLRRFAVEAGFSIAHEAPCMFPVVMRLEGLWGGAPYNRPWVVRADGFLSRLFRRNTTYHARNARQALRPSSAYLVLKK